MRRKLISITLSVFYLGIIGVYFLYLTGWLDSPILFQGNDWTNFYEQKIIAMKPTKLKKATSSPIPTSEPMGKPVQLVIDKIGVDAEVTEVGLVPGTNTMDVPKDGFKAGWYNQQPYPGQEGSSIITAHYDTSTGAPALFYKLKTLQKDDQFFLVDEYGHKIEYVVKTVDSLPVSTFPKDLIYKEKGYSQLSLITCSGIWNPVIGEYSNRLVVIATLKSVSSFGELVAMNKQAEIENMQPINTQVIPGKGRAGINVYDLQNQTTDVYLETSTKQEVKAVDLFFDTPDNFNLNNIEITDIFKSYIVEKTNPNILHIQLFQPQGYKTVNTLGMQVMIVRINKGVQTNGDNKKEINMLNYKPYESMIYNQATN